MSVTVTLVYPDAAAAASALARLAGVIAPEDRPDAGANVIGAAVSQLTAPVLPPAADPAAVFGAAPTPPAPVAALPVPPLPATTPASVPVPPAPTVPTAPAVAAAAPLPQRDSRGIPYDARIHSAPPSLTDKNIWRKKRGVDELTVNRIEAELTGAAAVPVPPVAVVPPAPPAPPVAAAPPVAEDFPALMARLGPYFVADMAGTTAKLTAALEPLGVTAFPMLATRPDLMPAATAAINAALA